MIIVVGSKFYGEPLKDIDNITSDVGYLLENPEKISLVLFTGGEDVHPEFYGGKDSNICMTNIQRDRFEKKVFEFCKDHDIKMTGICRGFQFLNVMCGGFMYQHITNHAGPHHGTYFKYDGKIRVVTSTHHQLVGLSDTAIPVAWSAPRRSEIYIGPNGHKIEKPVHEIESAIFPHDNAMGVQYHPEMLSKSDSTRIHYTGVILDFMNMPIRDFINKYGRETRHGRARKSGCN